MQTRASVHQETSATKAAKPARKLSPEYFANEPDNVQSFNPVKFSWSFGNMAVSAGAESPTAPPGLPWPVQAKLEVGSVSDPLEHEADRIAEQVMQAPNAIPAAAPKISSVPAAVQRKCSCGGTCDKCKSETSDQDSVQVQRKPAAPNIAGVGLARSAAMAASPIVHDVLREPGRPLDAAARAFFEPRFNTNFSEVRLHTGSLASQSALELNAVAYASGHHIVLGRSAADLRSTEGHRLLAHELAHVIQQTGTKVQIQRQPDPKTAKDDDKISIVKIVAHEDSTEGATAILSTGETTPVEITKNCYIPGEYILKHIPASTDYTLQTVRKQLAPTKKLDCDKVGFFWRKPKEYVWADTVTIVVVPEYIRKYFIAERDDKHAGADERDVLKAEEILTSFGVTEDELFLAQERRKDLEEVGHEAEAVNPTDWALSFVGTRRQEQVAALEQRESLKSAMVRLERLGPRDVDLAVGHLTNPGQDDENWTTYQIRYPNAYFEGFRDREDLWATLDQFGSALDKELRALTESTLRSTEVGIRKAQATFVGRWSRGVGSGYLEAELTEAKKDPEIIAGRRAISEEEANPQIDTSDLVTAATTKAAHDKRLESLNQKLNVKLGEKSRLKLADVKGFNAAELLTADAHDAQFMLGQVLGSAQSTVKDALNRLHNDDKFVWGADKIIAAEKMLLGIKPGSKTVLDQIIDGVVTKRLSEKSTWEKVWQLIDFVINFIPPPAGVILRAVAAGINIGQELDEYATKGLAYKANLSVDEPSAAGLAATVVFTAAGTVVDVGTSEMLAEKKALTLGLEEKGSASALAHSAEREGTTAVAGAEARQAVKGEGQIAKTAEEVVPPETLHTEIEDISRKASDPSAVTHPADPASRYDTEITASDGHVFHRDKKTLEWERCSNECKLVRVPSKVDNDVDQIAEEVIPRRGKASDTVSELPNLPRRVTNPKNYKLKDVAQYYREHRLDYPKDVQSLILDIPKKPTKAAVERVDSAIKDLHTAEANRMAGYANKGEQPFINSVKGVSNEGGEFSSLVTDQKQLTLVGQLKGGRGTAEFDSVQFKRSRIIETKMNLDRSTHADVMDQMIRQAEFAKDWNFSQVQWEVWDYVGYRKAQIVKGKLAAIHPELAERIEVVNPAQSH